MRSLLVIVLAICTATAGMAASINSQGVQITIPVPRGYKDVSKDSGAPANAALFETRAVEEWERIGELNETITVYGIGMKPMTDAQRLAQFDAIFLGLFTKVKARTEGRDAVVKSSNSKLIDEMYRFSSAAGARSVTGTQNAPTSKAFLMETGFTMPGVTTYPLVEEISMVLVKERIVVIQTVRVAVSPSVARQTRKIGAALRRSILKAAKAR